LVEVILGGIAGVGMDAVMTLVLGGDVDKVSFSIEDAF
jgi:hypothetical protein